jgi:hypothetical protein
MFTTTSVNAADDVRNLTDKTGDVFDFGGDETVTYPEITDIDMHYITYTQEDEKVTLDIEFVDIIEELDELIISISLTTSERDYEIGYWFGEIIGYYGDSEELEGITIKGFNSKNLIIKFNLIDEDEDYESLLIMTMKYSETEEHSYADMFPNLDDLPDVNITGPTEGEVGESIQFYGEASLGTAPYIYNWDFDEDGETDSTKQNPKFTFSEPGEYEIVLEILDSVGSPGGNITYITIIGSSQSGSDDSGAITFIILIGFVIIVGVAAVVFIIRR